MAKTTTLSVSQLVYTIAQIENVTGKSPIAIVNELRSGQVSESVWDIIEGTITRITEHPEEVIITGAMYTILFQLFRSMVGRKQWLKFGNFRITA